jgi:hypothetical protein
MGANGMCPDAVRDFRFTTLGKIYLDLAPNYMVTTTSALYVTDWRNTL